MEELSPHSTKPSLQDETDNGTVVKHLLKQIPVLVGALQRPWRRAKRIRGLETFRNGQEKLQNRSSFWA